MRRFLCIAIIISILSTLTYSFSDPLPTTEQSITGVSGVEENLADLSIEEKKVLEELFIIIQEVKEMEEIEKATGVEISDLESDIVIMEELIKEQTQKYDDNLFIMEELLKSYQKNGSTTYLDLILSSDSLQTLLRRFNVLRDIARGTNTLLEDLEQAKAVLVRDKEKLNETLILVQTRQKELKLALENKIKLKDELEVKLDSLQEDKAKFEEYLNLLENSWVKIKPIFSETITMLVKMIEDGNLPEETIDIKFSLGGVTGIIKEDMFRDILGAQKFPTKVDIVFSKDKLELLMPEININMSGTLELLDNKQSLRFNMEEGQYLGMKLEKSAMEELFSIEYLEFNFKKLLDKSTIRSIKINDDNLELLINPVLF